jgi:hypothetical protein
MALVLIGFGLCSAASDEQPVEEYRIKAAFLFNFAKFVEWPAGSFENPADPIQLCVLGKNPFGHALDDMVAGKTVDGRPLGVRFPPSAKLAAGCHILFIAAAEMRHAGTIIAELKSSGLLTVEDSDSGNHLSDGAVVLFRLEGDKVKIDIDTAAAEREKLRISSRLLTLARIVSSHNK